MCVCVATFYVCTISKQKLFNVNTALLPLVLDTIEHLRLFLSLYTNTHLLQSPIHIYTPANPPIHTHSFYKYMDIHTNIQYTLICISYYLHYKPFQTCTESLTRLHRLPKCTSISFYAITNLWNSLYLPYIFPTHPFSSRFHACVSCASLYLSKFITVPILFVFMLFDG